MMIDKLYEAVRDKSVVCVGLDTDFSYLPEDLQKAKIPLKDKIFTFNKNIIDATKYVAGCYKIQIAYYESMGIAGMEAYIKTAQYLKENNLISIGDIKRGDIAKTAEMYAKAHFTGNFAVDFVTLSPYMGIDSITPYMPYVESGEKGIFVLVRTSNQGSKDFEYLEMGDGERLYHKVGDAMAKLGETAVGKYGYSGVGVVMGGTHSDEAKEMRARLKNTFFLIPGYGAQGGTAKDIALYLNDGNGGVVNSSRGILLAYKKTDGMNYADAARAEVIRMKEDIEHECAVLRS